MNIGVFGDSFAEKTTGVNAWWKCLETEHNHTVTSYGSGGSSVIYSAHLINEKFKQYDFIIWCLTIPGRISVRMPDSKNVYHSTNEMDHHGNISWPDGNKPYKFLTDASRLYLKYIYDHEYEKLMSTSLISHLSKQISNLMIIPCFPDPLGSEFNLFSLSQMESNQIFSGKDLYDINFTHQDIRNCHLSDINNKILADKINQNFLPGIFQVSYDEFCFDNLDATRMFSAY